MKESGAAASARAEKQGQGYKFGTFKGVFTPSILTILGVIMYLRFGWVLGNVGLPLTLVIVTMSCAITFLTGLSIAALATNMKVGGGGAYFIISRSLGVEVGAAIGLPLYFAQALGISFYVVGFSESIVKLYPFLDPRLVGVVTLFALTLLAYISADLALKTQFLILAMIVASLVSFFMGGPSEALTIAPKDVPDKAAFWAVFAVFFPAVTGIEAGIAMSGDLKEPAKSLPLGTLGAVLTGFAVYLAIPIFLSRVVSNEEVLLTNSLVMRDVARWGDLILVGLWGASLSSAMGALLGAPRTLQALARDGVLPRVLGRGFGKGNDPRIATAVSFVIALIGILAGDLNFIAPILSMFFLTSYGFLNASAGFESLIASPSWRPKFRVHWAFSLLGGFGCLATMFMINPGATFIATMVALGVYYMMHRRHLTAHWGDMRYALLTMVARFAIYRLAERKPDERTWRPNILVLSGSPTTRWYLIELADAISHGKGFLTVAAVIPELPSAEHVENMSATVQDYLRKRGVPGLVKVHTAEDTLAGAQELIETFGFGPIVPNAVLLGETEREENFLAYSRLINRIYTMRRNLVIVREGKVPPLSHREMRIEVWWGGQRHNASLMLALAYLLQTSPEWADASLVLKTIVHSLHERDEAMKRLDSFISRGRLEAEAEVLIGQKDEIFDIIRSSSQGASLIFIGMRAPKEEESVEGYSRYYEGLLANTEGLPPTAIVLAAEDIEFHRIFI